VFAHIPLWTIYPDWGWATDDSEQALAYVQRFGSVTALNGHIHQVMQKIEGKVSFHTAMSTAFPQPAPGSAPSAGPDEGVRRPVAASSGNHGCELPGKRQQSRHRRFAAWSLRNFACRERRSVGKAASRSSRGRRHNSRGEDRQLRIHARRRHRESRHGDDLDQL
jgi:hypothetical protein